MALDSQLLTIRPEDMRFSETGDQEQPGWYRIMVSPPQQGAVTRQPSGAHLCSLYVLVCLRKRCLEMSQDTPPHGVNYRNGGCLGMML